MAGLLKYIDPRQKVRCRGVCGQWKIPLHFYKDKRTGRLSIDCKICRRAKTSVRTIPDLDAGEYQHVQSGYGGPVTNQFVRRRKT